MLVANSDTLGSLLAVLGGVAGSPVEPLNTSTATGMPSMVVSTRRRSAGSHAPCSGVPDFAQRAGLALERGTGDLICHQRPAAQVPGGQRVFRAVCIIDGFCVRFRQAMKRVRLTAR